VRKYLRGRKNVPARFVPAAVGASPGKIKNQKGDVTLLM